MKKRLYKTIGSWSVCVLGLMLIYGCTANENSPRGFRLPEGDIAMGKAAFIDLGCIQCHLVDGEEPMPEPAKTRDIQVVLGGEVTRVKTYGQLVTSIINPSHVIKREYRDRYTDEEGNSKMPDLTKNMSARQMIDIAEFLQSKYELVIPEYAYSEYGIGY